MPSICRSSLSGLSTSITGQRVYDLSFKLAVVRAVIEEGKKPRAVAVERQTSLSNVHKWVQQAYRNELDGYTPPTDEAVIADPMAEIRRLRKALDDMTKQRDFLKKTTVFFVKDQVGGLP
jgi:transposase-like protein